VNTIIILFINTVFKLFNYVSDVKLQNYFNFVIKVLTLFKTKLIGAMDYSLLKELIGYVEDYQKEKTQNQKIEDFLIWLNNKLFVEEKSTAHSTHDELLIAFKMMYLSKTLKKQTKSVLSNSKLSSIDEYSFLLHLDYQESFRKMEIIEMHNLEAPTGIEIIKRLLKKGLVEEFEDEEDRRAKRIKITAEGLEELKLIKPQIEAVFGKFSTPLNLNEKIQLSAVLNKLIGSN
jgi:DNA-binding MarR family transcriptional regulator